MKSIKFQLYFHFPIYNKIWAEYFAENPPCRTTLEINCLPTPIGIELKVIATI
jgi:2-aminomuconate deaminase